MAWLVRRNNVVQILCVCVSNLSMFWFMWSQGTEMTVIIQQVSTSHIERSPPKTERRVGRSDSAAEFCKGRLSVNSASQAFRSRMDNAAAVVVTKLTAYVPLPAELAALLSTGELWTFYLPLMYVVLFPVLNTFLAMFKECWKNAAKRRAKRVMRKLGVVALVTSPQRKGYKDLEAGGKKKAAPAKGKKGLSA